MLWVTTKGFTLAELLGAIAILAIITALAIPSFTGSDSQQKLDLAATEISHALEFVRSEAVRSGQPHALHSESNGQITVQTLDTSGVAPVLDAILRHPISKQYYRFNVLTANNTAGVELITTAAPFTFESSTGVNISVRDVYFNANGAPHFVDGSGIYYRLTSGSIGLRNGGIERSVSIASISGRVTVQ